MAKRDYNNGGQAAAEAEASRQSQRLPLVETFAQSGAVLFFFRNQAALRNFKCDSNLWKSG